MCDAAPPYLVINPLIFLVNIHSYPGSALVRTTILPVISASLSSSSITTSPSILLDVIKLGLASYTGIISKLNGDRITSGSSSVLYSRYCLRLVYASSSHFSLRASLCTSFLIALISATESHDRSSTRTSAILPILRISSSTRLSDLVNSNLKYSLCSIPLIRNFLKSFSGISIPLSSRAFLSGARSISRYFEFLGVLFLADTGLKFMASYLSERIS